MFCFFSNSNSDYSITIFHTKKVRFYSKYKAHFLFDTVRSYSYIPEKGLRWFDFCQQCKINYGPNSSDQSTICGISVQLQLSIGMTCRTILSNYGREKKNNCLFRNSITNTFRSIAFMWISSKWVFVWTLQNKKKHQLNRWKFQFSTGPTVRSFKMLIWLQFALCEMVFFSSSFSHFKNVMHCLWRKMKMKTKTEKENKNDFFLFHISNYANNVNCQLTQFLPESLNVCIIDRLGKHLLI